MVRNFDEKLREMKRVVRFAHADRFRPARIKNALKKVIDSASKPTEQGVRRSSRLAAAASAPRVIVMGDGFDGKSVRNAKGVGGHARPRALFQGQFVDQFCVGNEAFTSRCGVQASIASNGKIDVEVDLLENVHTFMLQVSVICI